MMTDRCSLCGGALTTGHQCQILPRPEDSTGGALAALGNVRVLGSCSLCGGRVVVPSIWYGIYPPVPTCDSCGAVKRENNGPVIDMVKK